MTTTSSSNCFAEIATFIQSLINTTSSVSSFFHSKGIHLEPAADSNADLIVRNKPARFLPPLENDSWNMEHVWVLSNNTACVVLSSRDYSIAMTLLKAGETEWKIISSMACNHSHDSIEDDESATDASAAPDSIIQQVIQQGAMKYIQANRAADGQEMSEVFHSVSRLTYIMNNTPDVMVHSCEDFCNMVTNRWNTAPYKGFAHLQNHVKVLNSDRIEGVLLLSEKHAVVKLTVGFPPFLYTDVLLLCKMNTKWWIVAKSSVNVPFMVDEK